MYLQKFPSGQAKAVVAKAREKHWHFKVLGNFGMPEIPAINNEWLYIPVTVDDPIIPKRALARVKVVQQMGLKTQGLIIAHEAPKQLCAPVVEPPKVEPVKRLDLASAVAEILRVLGSLFLVGLLLDPALIVVLDDGTWIEVMSWLDE